MVGLQRACQKRDVPLSSLEALVDAVERALIDSGEKEVPATLIGENVMPRLRELDEIAYVRFASVYKSFRDLDEFRAELETVARERSDKPASEPPSGRGNLPAVNVRPIKDTP
jgi:transcriptional repressor NrdR